MRMMPKAVALCFFFITVNAKLMTVDLSHVFDNTTTLYWPGFGRFELYTQFRLGPPDLPVYVASNRFCAPEHGGTHMDAASHFIVGGQAIHEIPLSRLVSKNVFIVDISNETKEDPDLLINQTHIEANENINGNGKLTTGAMVMLYTGRSLYWNDPPKYFGGDPSNSSDFHFPGLSGEVALWLATVKNISSVGIDVPSLDIGQTHLFAAHINLLKHNVPLFEHVKLSSLMPYRKKKDLTIIALPMHIKNGTGAPTRIIATYNDDDGGTDERQCSSGTWILAPSLLVFISSWVTLVFKF